MNAERKTDPWRTIRADLLQPVPAAFQSDADLRVTGRRIGRYGVWGLTALFVLLWHLSGVFSGGPAYAVLVAGCFLLGLPHGAVDLHVLAGFARGRGARPGRVALAGLAYLGLAFAVLALWAAFPALALTAFIALTAYHWGSGDAAFDRLFAATDTAARRHSLTELPLRGLLPMAVPAVAFPAEYAAAVQAFGTVLGENWAPGAEALRLAAILALAAAAVVRAAGFAGASASSGRPRIATPEVPELALLVCLFATVPPFPAIGFYFLFWHSLRHMLRLAGQVRESAGAAPPSPARRLRSVFTKSLPLSVAALLLAVLIALLLGTTAGGLREQLTVYLIFIACVTFPHVVVVGVQDWHDQPRNAAEPERTPPRTAQAL